MYDSCFNVVLSFYGEMETNSPSFAEIILTILVNMADFSGSDGWATVSSLFLYVVFLKEIILSFHPYKVLLLCTNKLMIKLQSSDSK